jgi:hypothetical protein
LSVDSPMGAARSKLRGGVGRSFHLTLAI